MVSDAEVREMLQPETLLGCPYLYRRHDNTWWADSDELRQWRATHTSTVKHE